MENIVKGLIKNKDVRTFILAGKSTFTLENEDKGIHITFKVTSPLSDRKYEESDDNMKKVYWVYAAVSYEKFIYIGYLNKSGFVKNSVYEDSKFCKSFDWLLKHYVETLTFDERVKIYHEGRCAHCGRPMRDPESIKTGFGPKCREWAKLRESNYLK